MKKTLALLLAVALIVGFMPVTAKADGTVRVYLSLSDDDQYWTDSNGNAIALRELNVPYFDLAYYGLQDFYFNTEYYGNANPANPDSHTSNLTPGTQANANGHVTVLHVLLYAMSKLLYGYTDAEIASGQLKTDGYLSLNDGYNPANSFTGANETICISGTPGSIYFETYWELDPDAQNHYSENWCYFVNYEYQLADTAWGRTADQTLVYDDYVITMAHFTDPSFFMDQNSVAAYAVPTDPNAVSTYSTVYADVGDTVELAMNYAHVDFWGTYLTSEVPFGEDIPVYCHSASTALQNAIPADITLWSLTPYTTDGDGVISINTTGWSAGTYIIAMPGQEDSYNSGAIVCAPGGIRLELSAN